VEAIANSPNFAGLEHLHLQGWRNGHGAIGVRGAEAIARSPYLTQLRVLSLFDCGIGDEGVRLLANSPNVSKVTNLNLAYNDLTASAVEALVNSPYLPERFESFPCLDPNEGISHAGRQALRERFAPDNPEPWYPESDEGIPF